MNHPSPNPSRNQFALKAFVPSLALEDSDDGVEPTGQVDPRRPTEPLKGTTLERGYRHGAGDPIPYQRVRSEPNRTGIGLAASEPSRSAVGGGAEDRRKRRLEHVTRQATGNSAINHTTNNYNTNNNNDNNTHNNRSNSNKEATAQPQRWISSDGSEKSRNRTPRLAQSDNITLVLTDSNNNINTKNNISNSNDSVIIHDNNNNNNNINNNETTGTHRSPRGGTSSPRGSSLTPPLIGRVTPPMLPRDHQSTPSGGTGADASSRGKLYRRLPGRSTVSDKYYRRFHATTNLHSKKCPNLSTPLQIIHALRDTTLQDKISSSTIKYNRPAALFFHVCWRTVDNTASELPEKRGLNELFSPNAFADEVSGYPAYIFNQCIKNRIESADHTQRAVLESILFPPNVDILPLAIQKRLTPAGGGSQGPVSPNDETADYEGPEKLNALRLLYEGPEDEKQIILREEKIVKAGTRGKLIERLTFEGAMEPEYMTFFLLTYRSFATPLELLHLLIARFNVQPKEELMHSPEYMKYFEGKAKLIRLRVCSVFKQWIEKHYYDFENDPTLLSEMQTFVTTVLFELGDTRTTGANLCRLLERKAIKDGDPARFINVGKMPPPMKSKQSSKMEWMNFHPLEFARQWSLLESEAFCHIQPSEFMELRWSKGKAAAPKIHELIHLTNLLPHWIQTEIVLAEKPAARAQIIKRVIKIGKMFEKLNNFNAMFEIGAALQGGCVFRLKQTWALIPKKTMDAWDDMRLKMTPEKNYKTYMNLLHTCNPPVLPFLGIYLTRLTALNENADNVGELINFEKRRMTAKVIREIQQYQQLRYCFQVVPSIQEFFQNLRVLSEAELFHESELREPKVKAYRS